MTTISRGVALLLSETLLLACFHEREQRAVGKWYGCAQEPPIGDMALRLEK
ncbi:hypothetical protein [Nostoc sp. DSM 114167]|jgi:hypothetical protein|uniref:hypothetical protein n=1 Tax=Nostoc sp. DSM 114167 TaxID=3439050 RepID=UPI00404576A0